MESVMGEQHKGLPKSVSPAKAFEDGYTLIPD